MSFTPLFKPKNKQAPEFRPSFNVGACLDLPVADFYTGKYGQYIMNGGFGNMIAVSGPGNSNKSTLTDYMQLSMMNRLLLTWPTPYTKYDTEETATTRRVEGLSKSFDYLKDVDLVGNGLYLLTNRSTEIGEEYYKNWKTGLESKVKEKMPMVATPFVTRSGEFFKILPPTQNSIDSITDFTTTNTDDMLAKIDLGDSKQNRAYLVQGKDKSLMLVEMPVYTSRYNDYMTITTHVAKKGVDMSSGPAKPPSKSNTHMKADERIKGLTEKVYYMFSAYWMTSVSRTYWQDGTKNLRYPKTPDLIIDGDVDLQTTDITLIRAKAGNGAGTRLTLVISQKEGIIPYLTEMDYCKQFDFGFLGNNATWSLALMPDVKMTRNTARMKFDENPKLRRAMNITSEICQALQYFRGVFPWIPTDMGTIVEGVKANGYDIDMILENTRGWWTLDDDKHPLKYLCFLDFVRMSLGTYHPYWLEDDKKTIKKEFQTKS